MMVSDPEFLIFEILFEIQKFNKKRQIENFQEKIPLCNLD